MFCLTNYGNFLLKRKILKDHYIGIITLLKRGNGYLPKRFYPDERFPTRGKLRAHSLANLLTLDANPIADSKFQWD